MQDKASVLSWSKTLYINEKECDKGLVISYSYNEMISGEVIVYLSFLLAVLAGIIFCYIARTDYFSQYITKIAPIVVLLMCIPILIVSIYSRPCVDNYNYSLITHEVIKAGNYSLIDL